MYVSGVWALEKKQRKYFLQLYPAQVGYKLQVNLNQINSR